MGGNLANYNFGGQGVNLVKNPLELEDGEATQLQNAEWVPDQSTGGKGALSKRGGLAALNGTPLAGAVMGMLGLTLKTTYVRTLYAALGSAAANTFKTSTDGSTWANTSSPAQLADLNKFTDESGLKDARRMTGHKTFLVYSGNGYTKNTDKPIATLWDGTNTFTVTDIPYGPSATANTPAYAITDWLVARGYLYLAVHDPGGSGANTCGRVMRLNLDTGALTQIAAAFGPSDTTGGYPACLAFYQDKIWVGLNPNATTDGIGKIVNCYPDIDSTWTTDVSNLRNQITSMAVFNGDLYCTTGSSVSTGAVISKRDATAGTWATKATSSGGSGGSGHYGNLIVYNSALYASEYHSSTPIVAIVKSSDGTTWSTDRNLASSDSAVAANYPAQPVVLNSKLYWVVRATTTTATDGFIMQNNAGTWTKVLSSANLAGPLATLVTRS